MGSYFVPRANYFFRDIRASGNVTASYFLGNGALLTGVTSTLPTRANIDIIGNVIAPGNITVAGQVNVTGNVTGSYFIGNGALLTGVTATLPSIVPADIRGNLIGVYANVANIIAVGGNVGNTRFLGGNVAVSGQINTLGNVVAPFFIGNGSQLTGVTATLPTIVTADIRGNLIGVYANVANIIAVEGNVGNTRFLGGNVAVSGQINTLGNVVAPFFIGNGSQLTGVTATLPSIVPADIRGNLIGVYANVANIIAVEGNVGNTRFLGGNVAVSGQINTLGNVVAPFFIGNGSQLTGVTATLPSIVPADIRGNLIGVYANVANIIAVEGNVGNTRFLGGNVAVSGQINTLGNVVAPFFIGNGSQLTGVTATLPSIVPADIRGNLIGVYANVSNIIAVEGNVGNTRFLGGNVAVSGQINTLGNVVAPFFIGNGSQLTGVTATLPTIVTADIRGNLIGVYANVSNIIAVEGNVGNTRFLGGNVAVSGQINTLGNVVAPFFIGNGSQLTGVTATLPTIVTADIRGNLIGVYANVSNIIAVEGNVGNTRFLGGNVAVSGQINTLGNVVAPFFIGNGSQLTGVTATLPTIVTADIRGNLIGVYANVSNIIAVEGNVGNTRFLGGNVAVSGQINTLGNVVAPFFIGNGSQLTGVTATLPTIVTADIRGNLIGVYANVSNIIAVEGNVGNTRFLGGNVAVSGQVNVLGNVTASFFIGNVVTTGNVDAGNVTTTNMRTNGNSVVTGQVNVLGNVTASFFIGNVVTTGNVDAGNVTTTNMRTNGNSVVTGQVNVLGNVTASFFIGNGSQLTGIAASTLPGVITADTRGNQIGVYANVANVIAVEGNIGNIRMLGGNVAVSGQVNVLGNVTASFFIGNGSQLTGISASALPGVITADTRGNQIGVYANVANVIAVEGNIGNIRMLGGNVAVSGQVNVLGNVTASFFIGNGSQLTGISASALPGVITADTRGNQIGVYANVANVIAVEGNIGNIRMLGGNVAVSGQVDVLGNVTASFFIGNGSQLTGISASALPGVITADTRGNQIGVYANVANVIAVEGNIGNIRMLGGNVAVSGQVNVLGNVTASFFIGNGSRLTGIAASALPGVISADFRGNQIGAYANVDAAISNTSTIICSSNSNAFTVNVPMVTDYFSTMMYVTTARGSTGNYSFLRLDNSGGRVLNLDGTGALTVTTQQPVSNGLTLNCSSSGYASAVIQANVNRGAVTGYSFLRCDNTFGRVLDVAGTGAIIATTPVNDNVLSISSTIGSYSNTLVYLSAARGVTNAYSFLRCDSASGNIRAFDLDGRGAITSNCGADANVLDVTAAISGFTSSVLNMRTNKAEGTDFNFINCVAGTGATNPFRVNGKGDVSTTGQVSVIGNGLSIQTTSFFSSNGILVNIPRNSSVAEYSFITCTNTTGNIFNINGRGTTTVTTPVSSPALSVESTAATGAYISDVARIRTTAAGDGTFNFINCSSDAAAISRFSVNGLGNITAAGAMAIMNAATFTCGANANILTVSGTTLDNSGASLIQATTLRGNNAAYSLLRLDNVGGRMLDVDGTGSMFLTSASTSDIMVVSTRSGALVGNAINITVPKLSFTDYSFITCRNSNGILFNVDGRGMLTAQCAVNGNVVNVNSTSATNTNDMIRIQSSASAAQPFNMISAKNAAGNVFRVNGAGGVFGVGAFNTSGADYAEMFEWEDGNKLDEDRRGITVVLGNNGMIHMATETDNPADVIGVVSVNPSVLGDTKWNEWSGRYLRDKFGTKLSNTVYYISNVSNEAEIVRCGINDNPLDGYTKHTSSEFIQNPKYDPNSGYISRENRPEWSPIGIMGKLRVLPDQVVNPGWKLLRTYKHPDGDTLEYLVK